MEQSAYTPYSYLRAHCSYYCSFSNCWMQISWELYTIVCLFRYQVQAVASLLQSILKQLSSEKEERKYRTVFVFGCMERLTKLLRNHRLQGMIDFTMILLSLEFFKYSKTIKKCVKLTNLNKDIINYPVLYLYLGEGTLRLKILCYLEDYGKVGETGLKAYSFPFTIYTSFIVTIQSSILQ